LPQFDESSIIIIKLLYTVKTPEDEVTALFVPMLLVAHRENE